MTEMVTSGSMSGDARRSDGLLGESGHERRRSQQAPPVLYATARVLDSTTGGSGVWWRSPPWSCKLGRALQLTLPASPPCPDFGNRLELMEPRP